IWWNWTEGPNLAAAHPPPEALAGSSPSEPAVSPEKAVPLVTLAAIGSSQSTAAEPPPAVLRDARECGKKRLRPYTILLPATNAPQKSPLPKSLQANNSHGVRPADRNTARGSAGAIGYVAKTRYEYSRVGRFGVWIRMQPLPIQSPPARLFAVQNGPQV